MKTTVVRVMAMPSLGLSADGMISGRHSFAASVCAWATCHTETAIEKYVGDVKEPGVHAWISLDHLPGRDQCAHRQWSALPGRSTPHRPFSGDAALAQRLAELDEVVLPGPAHPPDPGPDVAPARTDKTDCHRCIIAEGWRMMTWKET